MSYREYMTLVDKLFFNEYGVDWQLLLGDFPTRDFYDDKVDAATCVHFMAMEAGV